MFRSCFPYPRNPPELLKAFKTWTEGVHIWVIQEQLTIMLLFSQAFMGSFRCSLVREKRILAEFSVFCTFLIPFKLFLRLSKVLNELDCCVAQRRKEAFTVWSVHLGDPVRQTFSSFFSLVFRTSVLVIGKSDKSLLQKNLRLSGFGAVNDFTLITELTYVVYIWWK